MTRQSQRKYAFTQSMVMIVLLLITINLPIRLKLIGGDGRKAYNILASRNMMKLYNNKTYANYYGDQRKLKKHISNDSSNTAFLPVNLYNTALTLITAGYNFDDGLMLGGGVKYTRQEGFRKTPFTNMQQLLVSVAFATGSFKIKYTGDWIHVAGKADLTIDARILAPDNTQNFFGVGNSTSFNKTGNYKRYYRARFSVFEFDPALRWRFKKNTNISIGPSLQYYRYDPNENTGRFITNSSLIHSYDSATIEKDKAFAGFAMNFSTDNRNNKIVATSGGFFKIKLLGYTGLNKYSKSYLQATSEIAIYKSIGRQSRVTIADRVGGGLTFGKAAFYQSLFAGGQDNLLGYRQYRFAGNSMLYNNLEVRVKLAEVSSYIFAGTTGAHRIL